MQAIACIAAGGDYAKWVDPFIGTSATGHTFPGACMPFGMVQPGPDTGNYDWEHCSGYRFDDDSVLGFSQTHLNGTGCPDMGDISLLPFTGDAALIPSSVKMDKHSEAAEPGYYCVTLEDGTKVEATATERCAIYRITFAKPDANVLVNLPYGIGNLPYGTWGSVVMREAHAAENGKDRISGSFMREGWSTGRRVAFDIRFSRQWNGITELPPLRDGEPPRFVASFGDIGGKSLLVKVALSIRATRGASKNLEAELPGWDFDAVRTAAREKWNELLGRIEIEGTEKEKRNFYTALYHLFIQPNDLSDVDEKPFYSTLSTWDTFRAAHPLYTILTPERVPGFVDSMIEQGRITGHLPIWALGGVENQCMVGTHSVPVMVDAFLKGFPADWESAYVQIKETLTKSHPQRLKERWDLYDTYGYYPFDIIKGESVSRTMECAYDDWCAGVMAEKLGHQDDAKFFFKRSGNWRNIFDESIGLVRGKDSKGKWREPYNPYALGSGAERANDFTEGNAFQYTWHVMHDPNGLIEAMGGRERFAQKLDALFSEREYVEGMGHVSDVTGLIGQYVHGNEPSHHVIYFYPLIGQSPKAAKRIREVFERFYLPKPDGLCGNEDCGQMSAWFLFSALGFYPFNPCGGEYVIGAPQVKKATLNLPGGKKFTITAEGLSDEGIYVKSASLNGKPIEGCIIRHEDIVSGGELVFTLSPE